MLIRTNCGLISPSITVVMPSDNRQNFRGQGSVTRPFLLGFFSSLIMHYSGLLNAKQMVTCVLVVKILAGNSLRGGGSQVSPSHLTTMTLSNFWNSSVYTREFPRDRPILTDYTPLHNIYLHCRGLIISFSTSPHLVR